MRITLLAANFILFAVSFIHSLQIGLNRSSLSTWTALCFGILMIFNIRSFWIFRHKMVLSGKAHHQILQYDGPEKRTYFRVVYEQNRRPRIIINDTMFDVIDFSQKGLRFLNPKELPLHGRIEGKVIFPDGDIIDVAGNIEWKKAAQVSLHLSTTISHSFIKKELSQLV
ncbi:MAG: hypothetical protein EHM45_24740 [Desulfobacteraceae bacterium]|nr:MAG: hypothetical protein EHM45_24740 [Desulfobacteraceae bacterium]